MSHGHLNCFQNHLLKVDRTQNYGDHATLTSHNRWFVLFYHVWRPRMNRHSLTNHLVEGPVTYDFTLQFMACVHTTWFWKDFRTAFEHFFGLSQDHGHTSWLICEVALILNVPIILINVLLFGVTQCNNVLLWSSISTSKSSTSCLNFIGHKWLFFGKELHSC